MIKLTKYFTKIYINYEINFIITTKIKLNTTNIDKFNLKLIKISIYFFQFWFEMRHCSEKFNVISNVFNKLLMTLSIKKNSLNIDTKNSNTNQMYIYATTLMKMSIIFRKALIENYVQNSTWKKIISMLQQLFARFEKKNFNKSSKIKIDFIMKNKLIYHILNVKRLCVLSICEKIIFELTYDQNNHANFHKTYH